MRVRVAVFAPFEAQPKQERFFVRAWDNVRHDVPYLQLDAESVQKSHEVGVVSDPGAAVLPCCLRVAPKRRSRVVRVASRAGSKDSGMETVQIISMVVREI